MNSTFASRGPRGRDGSFGATGATGPAGPPGQSNSVFSYLAETGATSGYPGDGAIIWNNATQTSATSIIVSHIDADGTDQGSVLSVLETVSKFYLQDRVDNAKVQEWTITGTPTLVASGTASERWEIPVSLASGTHSFADADELIFVLAAGIQGPTGPTGATGATGAAGGVTMLGSVSIIGTGTNLSSSLLEGTLASFPITVPANGKVRLEFGGTAANNANNAETNMYLEIQGNTTRVCSSVHHHTAAPRGAFGSPLVLTGLTPGAATVRVRWQASTGTKSLSPTTNANECLFAAAYAVA